MSEISEFSSGKGHTDENFPVASVLIHPRYRAPILAFYRFVRAADDVADNATAAPEVKLAALEQLRLGLIGEAKGGEADGPPEALALRKARRKVSSRPRWLRPSRRRRTLPAPMRPPLVRRRPMPRIARP